MKKPILLFIILSLCSYSLPRLSACTCAFPSNTFCGTLNETNSNVLLFELLSQDTVLDQDNNPFTFFNVLVLERLSGDISEDTIRLAQGFGADCFEWISALPGDTLLANLMPHWWQEESYAISICGIHFLNMRSGTLYGPIAQGVDALAYDDFLTGLSDCFDTLADRIAWGTLQNWRDNRPLIDFGYTLNDQMTNTGPGGNYGWSFVAPNPDSSQNLYFEKTNEPLRGISSQDLVLILKHLLGKEEFNTPYQLLAADVNGSGTITTLDLIQLQRLLLGAINQLPTDWLFLPEGMTFEDKKRPRRKELPVPIRLYFDTSLILQENVIVIKIGDVNGDFHLQ